MFIIVIVIGLELNYGLLLGTHDYVAYNLLRLAPIRRWPRSALIALWALDELTVKSALIATNVAYLFVLVVGMVRVGQADRCRPRGPAARARPRSGSAFAGRARRWPRT